MLIFDIKENEYTYNRQVIYQPIYMEAEIAIVKRVSQHLQCSNIYDDMQKL